MVVATTVVVNVGRVTALAMVAALVTAVVTEAVEEAACAA